jgi:hypothetical protein
MAHSWHIAIRGSVPNGTSFPRTSFCDQSDPSALNESPQMRRRARPFEVPIRKNGEVVDLAAGFARHGVWEPGCIEPGRIPAFATMTLAAVAAAAIAQPAG